MFSLVAFIYVVAVLPAGPPEQQFVIYSLRIILENKLFPTTKPLEDMISAVMSEGITYSGITQQLLPRGIIEPSLPNMLVRFQKMYFEIDGK